jgi:hypothetical protein
MKQSFKFQNYIKNNPLLKEGFIDEADEYTETNLLNIINDIRSHIETSSVLDTGFKEYTLPQLDTLDYNIQNEEWDDALMDLEDLDDSIRQVARAEWQEVYRDMFEKAIRRVEALALEAGDEDLDEAKRSVTNAEELQKTEDLLAKAHEDRNWSVMSAYEYRIKMLKILNALEKKYGKPLPVFTTWSAIDYINDNFPGFKERFGPYKQNWRAVVDHIEKSLKGDVNEGDIQEAYVPDNIKSFAKRKGVLPLVNQIARWAEKAGKRIVGGTAIGKNYATLILDLTYQGGEIYINTDNDTVEVNGIPVNSYDEFADSLN